MDRNKPLCSGLSPLLYDFLKPKPLSDLKDLRFTFQTLLSDLVQRTVKDNTDVPDSGFWKHAYRMIMGLSLRVCAELNKYTDLNKYPENTHKVFFRYSFS